MEPEINFSQDSGNQGLLEFLLGNSVIVKVKFKSAFRTILENN
jgi:hypothetical protein